MIFPIEYYERFCCEWLPFRFDGKFSKGEVFTNNSARSRRWAQGIADGGKMRGSINEEMRGFLS